MRSVMHRIENSLSSPAIFPVKRWSLLRVDKWFIILPILYFPSLNHKCQHASQKEFLVIMTILSEIVEAVTGSMRRLIVPMMLPTFHTSLLQIIITIIGWIIGAVARDLSQRFSIKRCHR